MPSTGPISVLTDEDVEGLADMAELVRICAAAIDADAAGGLIAPPRIMVDVGPGKLVFTAGGNSEAVGFRAYETFPTSRDDQLVAVWHPDTGELAGVVVGELLGALRTGAIGGVAVDRMAPVEATRCAVIGSGLQARTQLMACAAVRGLAEVAVYSRDEERRRVFAREMSERIGVAVRSVDSPAAALDGAEIALLATSSGQPVAAAAELNPVAHISTVGPKFVGQHELPLEAVGEEIVIASDSPQQVREQGEAHFLHGTSAWERVQHLGRLEPAGRTGVKTLFLSAGLAGTEVLIADHLLAERARHG